MPAEIAAPSEGGFESGSDIFGPFLVVEGEVDFGVGHIGTLYHLGREGQEFREEQACRYGEFIGTDVRIAKFYLVVAVERDGQSLSSPEDVLVIIGELRSHAEEP